MLSQSPTPEAPPSAAALLGAMAAELRAKAAELSARPGPGPMARARLLLALAALVETVARMVLRWQEGQDNPIPRPRAARPSTAFPADRAVTWSRSRRTTPRTTASLPTAPMATARPDSARPDSASAAAHRNPAPGASGARIPSRAQATSATQGEPIGQPARRLPLPLRARSGLRGQCAPNAHRRTAPAAPSLQKREKGRAHAHALFVP